MDSINNQREINIILSDFLGQSKSKNLFTFNERTLVLIAQISFSWQIYVLIIWKWNPGKEFTMISHCYSVLSWWDIWPYQKIMSFSKLFCPARHCSPPEHNAARRPWLEHELDTFPSTSRLLNWSDQTFILYKSLDCRYFLTPSVNRLRQPEHEYQRLHKRGTGQIHDASKPSTKCWTTKCHTIFTTKKEWHNQKYN